MSTSCWRGCRWVRLQLVLCEVDGEDRAQEQMLGKLEELAQQLHRRPYLPRTTPERTLCLLCALFRVRPHLRKQITYSCLYNSSSMDVPHAVAGNWPD